ncbi:hypothetical protein [Paraburkholderia nodosa]|uniref:hypothetical protein n=1 Tax=Paraburkholderia nodosa TaxID=392320 RepID=UPI00114C97CD|nr:hypothetical protein [Paraburkholderia nodosa]
MDRLLEDQLDDILAAIYRRHRVSSLRVAEWAEREQRSKEAEIRRHEQERQRAARQRESEEENNRRQALILEAKKWRHAELIRAYLALLDSGLGRAAEPSDEYVAWREWALGVADDLDPTYHRMALRVRPDQG